MSTWCVPGLAVALTLTVVLAVPVPAHGQTAARASQPRVGLTAATCSASGVAVPTALRTAMGKLVWSKGLVPWTTWPVTVGTARWSVDLIVARVDTRRVSLELAIQRDGSALAPWRIDNAPTDAVIALNAGQFTDDGPWGWVVHRGREWQPAGSGSLAAAFVIDSGGGARIVPATDIGAARARGGIREAVQSYPQLLSGGALPAALCDSAAVHPTHRDIRLAIGTKNDGSVLIVLSRYAGMGRAADRAPIGPTTHEMALVMATLGVRDAVLLDGGLSGQLSIRDSGANSKTHDWPGLRGVPLALIGRAAAELASPSLSR
ncbi:MAG: phosphodiester glycosidase family protein [Gemmatimonadaceae bacterium]|nr:phosphodiester glycosidase family protein [Gemmatimonadaceae bacterium]